MGGRRRVVVILAMLAVTAVLVWTTASRRRFVDPAQPSADARVVGTRSGPSRFLWPRFAPLSTPTPATTGVIEGLVETASGDPVGGAEVGLSRYVMGADQTLVAERQTGADGLFRFDSVEPGMYTVAASTDGHPPEEWPVEAVAGSSDDVDLVLADADGVLVHGVVSDDGGGPIADVRVEFDDAIARTDASGAYRIVLADSGTYRVTATHSEYGTLKRYATIDVQGATLDLELAPAATIEGRVLRADGAPAAGADVELSPAPLALRGQRHALAGDRGEFLFDDLADGEWNVGASLGSDAGALDAPITLAEGQRLAVDVHLTPAFTISGRVTIVGAPADDAFVTLSSYATLGAEGSVETGPDGRYSFSAIRPGRHRLVASARGTPITEVFVDIADADVVHDVALDAGASICGSVLAPDGRTVADATVYARTTDGGRYGSWMDEKSDAEGHWCIDELSAGRYVVYAVKPSIGAGASDPVDVADGDRASADVRLARQGAIVGTVRASDGAPVHGAVVIAAPDSDDVSTVRVVQATSDANGHYRLDPVPDGPLRISVYAPAEDGLGVSEDDVARRSITMPADGEEATVDFVLPAPSR